MAVAWLVFTLATFHMCVKPTCCAEGTGATTVVDELNSPLITSLNASGGALVVAGAGWEDRLAELKRAYAANPDQALEVVGHYYASERTPDGYENMGFLRAERIVEMVAAQSDIPTDKMRTSARLLPGSVPEASQRFSAGVLAFGPPSASDTGAGEIIELDRDNIEILFPYNEATESLDGATENYLRKLAQRLQATNEEVTVVGHTDIRGTNAYNQRLGQRRADFVKRKLIDYGAPAGQIKTSSRGESQLAARGTAESDHRRNRRTEISLQRR